MELPITIICLSLLALLGVTTGQISVLHRRVAQPQDVRHPFILPHLQGPDGGYQPAYDNYPGRPGPDVGFQPEYAYDNYPLRPAATEKPVLSGIHTPANDGYKELEMIFARPPTQRDNSLLTEFLKHVTQKLQEKIRSDKLDPLAVGGLQFDDRNIDVKIEPGTFTGLCSVVLIGGLVNNSHGEVKGVRVSGDLGKLMGSSVGLAKFPFSNHTFGVKTTIAQAKILMDVKVDKVGCKLIVEDLHIKLGAIKVEVTGVPPNITHIKDSVVNQFGSHLEELLNSQSDTLKTMSNTDPPIIPESDTLKNNLDCNRRCS